MAYTQQADGAHEPFLGKTEDEDGGIRSPQSQDQQDPPSTHQHPTDTSVKQCRRSPGGISARHISLHIILVAMYTLLSALTVYALRHPALGGVQNYTPPAWLPEAKLQPFLIVFSDDHSLFLEPGPNTTVDGAWDKLLQFVNIRATDDELTLSGDRSSVKYPSTSESTQNNLARLNVFHGLQCLRLLRETVHRFSYDEQSSEKQPQELISDANRCIEMLRESIMCRPDLTLEVFKWTDTNPHPVFDDRMRVRECVDWDAMMSSLQGRLVSDEEVSRLVNPLLPNPML